MGGLLTRAAQWTNDSSGCCKLEATQLNEFLLKEVLHFTEQLMVQHPEEATHVFEEPLVWSTTLEASDFKAGYDVSDLLVESHDKDSEGRPLLRLKPPTISVRSFSQLSKLLHLAENNTLAEVRECLQGNKDLVAIIFGRSFVSFMEKEDVNQDVQSLMVKIKEREPSEDVEAKIKVFLLLQKKDKEILNKLLQHVTEQSERVWIVFSDYEFSNGCNAPLWRQLLGEICYVVLTPCDTDTLYITCSNDGVFLNKGIKQDGQESGYERISEVYRDLVTLLKHRSPYFAANIKTQVQKSLCCKTPVTFVTFSNLINLNVKQQENKEEEKTVHHHVRNKACGTTKYEPCPRWRKLGLSSTRGYVIILLPHKSSVGAMPSELFSESSSESEEEEQPERRQENNTDLPSEYWQIQKLVIYLKGGNQTATVLTLCAMMDFNLMQETCQLAIRDAGGLEVLINLLDTDEVKCKIGSLKILRKICNNMQIRRIIVDMGGLQSVVKILDSPVKDLKALAAETIANVAKFRRARRTVRQHGGIKKLVKLLACVPNLATLSVNQEQDVEVARCGALALWSCSNSTKNKEAIRRAGGIPLLGRLLKSPHENMLIPVVGTLQECASEESYRIAIQTEGMIKDLVINLSSDNDELQMHCASAIFKCAEDKQTRDLVRKYKGLQPLVTLLGKANNKELLAAATGAIWKCSISKENVAKFQEFKALEIIVGLLTDQPEEVLVNVVGALGEFAQISANKAIIRKCGGIRPLVGLLTGTNQALLVNVTKAVGACATDKDNMAIIDQLDGVRLVWSLLKNSSADVQSSAAWALCPCIKNAKDAGEMVRSLVGGLELIVNLLKSTNIEVQASICAVVATIAKDKENLAVLTDHGVIPLLAKLTNTSDNRLRRYLADAIGHCCMWGTNRSSFGDATAVAPLVRYLKAKDSWVNQSTAMALYQLSKDPYNCITMYEKGAVKPLIQLMGSDDETLQEAAAGCVRNIRLLAQANRQARLFN
uniref:Armadillo repeat containing 4 n=1 Tax=Gouania willdenowi TaxID=441366 RepID=A0A8C5HBE3_GOUWI